MSVHQPLRNARRFALVVAAAAMTLTVDLACSTVECGEGTLEVDGVCKAPDDSVRCGPGFDVRGGECVPSESWLEEYCDKDTAEVRDGRCVGIGGGPTGPCDQRCSEPSGGKICVSGRVFGFAELVAQGADKAAPVAKAEGLKVSLYEPVAYFTNPAAVPIGGGEIYNAEGCFIIEDVIVPAINSFIAVVEDDKEKPPRFVRAGLGVTASATQNVTEVQMPAVTPTLAEGWGAGLLAKGAIIHRFLDDKGAPVSGVVPTTNGQPAANVLYLDDTAKAVDGAATATGSLGLAIAPEAPLGGQSGMKQGCTIPTLATGSAPNSFFIITWTVSGC